MGELRGRREVEGRETPERESRSARRSFRISARCFAFVAVLRQFEASDKRGKRKANAWKTYEMSVRSKERVRGVDLPSRDRLIVSKLAFEISRSAIWAPLMSQRWSIRLGCTYLPIDLCLLRVRLQSNLPAHLRAQIVLILIVVHRRRPT